MSTNPGVTYFPLRSWMFAPGGGWARPVGDTETTTPRENSMSTPGRKRSPSNSVAFCRMIVSFCPLDGFHRGFARDAGTGKEYVTGGVWRSAHFWRPVVRRWWWDWV